MSDPRIRRLILTGVALIAGVWLFLRTESGKPVAKPQPSPSRSETKAPGPSAPVPGDALLAGYGDPSTPPMEDMKKIHRVVTGYFSVIKDASRFPIGGNGDLAAALRGENPNREVFVKPGHRIFSQDGLLIDRWGSPLIVHPEAWKQLELRSAGPDRVPYNEDDLVIGSNGLPRR